MDVNNFTVRQPKVSLGLYIFVTFFCIFFKLSLSLL